MIDKKLKKEIDKVITKYVSTGKQATSGALAGGIKNLPVTGAFLGLDLIFTGGIGTLGAVIASGIVGGGSLYGAANKLLDKKLTAKNTAQQTIEGNSYAIEALKGMEAKLKDSFNKASSPDAPQIEKDNFLSLAAEVKKDTQTLYPVFKIAASGPGNFGTDEYVFIVAENQFTGPGKREIVTLAEALQKLSPAGALQKTPGKTVSEKTAEDRIQELQERIDSLQNPVITKKKLPPSSPPRP